VNTKLTKQGVGGKYSYLGKMGEAELAAAQHLVSSSSSPGLELKSFITTDSGGLQVARIAGGPWFEGHRRQQL
jgi:hypothetical protein